MNFSLRRRCFGRRFKVLIGVWIRCGPRNNVEAELRRLMASVAPFRELIECFRESILVLRFDRLIEFPIFSECDESEPTRLSREPVMNDLG